MHEPYSLFNAHSFSLHVCSIDVDKRVRLISHRRQKRLAKVAIAGDRIKSRGPEKAFYLGLISLQAEIWAALHMHDFRVA